jgi:inhibitor of cysteine peptidase
MKSLRVLAVVIAITLLVTLIRFTGVDAAQQSSQTASTASSIDRFKDAVVLFVGSSQALVNAVEKQVDPSNPEVRPFIQSGKTLVPINFIASSLKAKVEWEGKTSTVTVKASGKTIKLALGNKKMWVNNTGITLEVPAQAVNGRTFVPLSAVAKALDKKVFYERGLIVVSSTDLQLDRVKDKTVINGLIARVNNLPVVGTESALKELLSKLPAYGSGGFGGMDDGALVRSGVSSTEASNMEKAEAPQAKAAAGDYSTTNVQVEGVDEADTVKTDGEYIYQINRQRIVISRAYPAGSMKMVSTTRFPDTSFYPQELYLYGKYMVVIGNSSNPVIEYSTTAGAESKIMPPRYRSSGTVKAIVYDITDRSKIRNLREVEIEGSYLSSRMVGGSLYLIGNRYLNYYGNQSQENEAGLAPSYRDTAAKDEFVLIGCDKIRYFPRFETANYMVLAGINLDRIGEEAKITAYLGAGQNIYASQQNLYVAVTRYQPPEILPMTEIRGGSAVAAKSVAAPANSQNTVIYKFSLDNGNTTYISRGEVPGTLLNQFSMDEQGKHFRVATTKGDVWRNDENTSKNNVYVLDEMLNITGRVEDMAPGEKIYSVRFLGDRAYVVTFKTVDPLFVLDLKDPTRPRILGALKIPGYSDYLHPYDENHIIGFGKDTVEMKGNAYYQGMKMAMFDVSDVSHPKQMFVETIGDRGTDSELLRNHKALLFSREKNLLAFPVTVMEVKDDGTAGNGGKDALAYGQFAFQGAYVYSIDMAKGFLLRGKITHLSEEDYLKAGNYNYDMSKNVERILYIKDMLYTLSQRMIRANGMSDLKEMGALEIP